MSRISADALGWNVELPGDGFGHLAISGDPTGDAHGSARPVLTAIAILELQTAD